MSRYKDIDLCTKIIKKEFSYIKCSGVSMYKKGRRDGLVGAHTLTEVNEKVLCSTIYTYFQKNKLNTF